MRERLPVLVNIEYVEPSAVRLDVDLDPSSRTQGVPTLLTIDVSVDDIAGSGARLSEGVGLPFEWKLHADGHVDFYIDYAADVVSMRIADWQETIRGVTVDELHARIVRLDAEVGALDRQVESIRERYDSLRTDLVRMAEDHADRTERKLSHLDAVNPSKANVLRGGMTVLAHVRERVGRG